MMAEKNFEFPSVGQIEAEIRRTRVKRRRARARRTILILLLLALIAGALISMKYVSFLKISGNSMESTLRSGDVAIYQMNGTIARGSIVVIERDGELLVKRVIGIAGDKIRVAANGVVYVNGAALEETYLEEKSLGNSDAIYPTTVPENSYFVMGDRRSTSLDSRNSAIGMISADEIRGEILGVLWPAYRIGKVQ